MTDTNHLLAEFVRGRELQQHAEEVPEFDLQAFDAACEGTEVALVAKLVQDMNGIHGGWKRGIRWWRLSHRLRPEKVVGLAGAEPLEGDDLLNQERVKKVAADFPKCTFLIEHLGFPWTEELFGVMASCPNVWTDISMARARPHLLAWNLTMARDCGLFDRITWGTGYVGKRIDQWQAALKVDVDWLQKGA